MTHPFQPHPRPRSRRLPGRPTVLALAVGSALVSLFPVSGWAQEEAGAEPTLRTVTVIGTTPLPGTGLERNQVAAAVQTASGEDLAQSHARDLADFMNQNLGSVSINEVQGNPYQPDVNYRGYTASPLLGTAQGLSVYMDGVRMNQPFGDVMSWDLIPSAAIDSMVLMPGSNPLFGLNTLGGALVVQSRDGLTSPRTTLTTTVGSHARRGVEFAHGGSNDQGLHWFGTGHLTRDPGWRADSRSDVQQWFGKLGWQDSSTQLNVSLAHADNTLNGNGLQEQRFLERDWSSVYTRPDTTRNRSTLLNFFGQHQLDNGVEFSGNAYLRRIRTGTYNADINEGSLDQSVYQPGAAERTALAGAGYTGFPTSGANAANTPFPFWRCIGQALLNDEPGEKCNGLINQTQTAQRNHGLSGQWSWRSQLAGNPSQTTVGAAYDASRVSFSQTAQLGYLNPDRTVTGVNAFADGVSGGNVDGEPYDSRVSLNGRTRVTSVYAANTLTLGRMHLTTSARYNDNRISNTDLINAAGSPASLSGEHRFSRLNPAVGLTYAPASALTAYVAYSEGSRAPSTIELGCANPDQPCKLPNSMAGDPALRQVVTKSFEGGVRGKTDGGLNWNVGAFRAVNHDDIQFVADDQAGFGYFKNFGKTRRQGLEWGLGGKVGQFRLGANLTWLDATFQSTETLNGTGNSSNDSAAAGVPGVDGTITVRPGDRIPLLPRQILKLNASYQASSTLSLGASIVSQGSMLARGNENNAHQPDGVYYLGSGKVERFTVLNVSVKYKPAPRLELFFKVDNLFNTRYKTSAQLGATGFDKNGNFIARPFAPVAGQYAVQQATFYAPGAPRAFLLGLKYQFD